MTDDRDIIRSRIDILDLVGQTVQLKKTGKTWKGLCPFHPDKNPSFHVSPETGRYRCWSCQESGDIFTWVMKTQNMEFHEALEWLAKRAGITLQHHGRQEQGTSRKNLEASMDAALAFFREQLPKCPPAVDYCKRRGLDDAVLASWELGWAPDQGEALAVHLKRQGFSLADCEQVFLVSREPDGTYRDKFRGRLIFPIRDERGQLVAFGGRITGDGQPKYINSSDTPLYRKSKVLYGLHRAKERLNKERKAVLVEGYLDVIASHRAGVDSALASLGTALSEEHAKLLKRWCEEVTVLYDSDSAGQKAAERAIGILESEGLKVRLALMPEGDDPDTLLKRSGPKAVQDAVTSSLVPLDYRMERLLRTYPPAEEEFWDHAVQLLSTSKNELELDRWLVRLATMYPSIREPIEAQKSLKRWVARVKRQESRLGKREGPQIASEHKPLPEQLTSLEFVMLMAFCSEEFRSPGYVVASNADGLFSTHLAVSLGHAVRNAFPDGPPTGPIGNWLHRIEPETLRTTLNDLIFDFRSENLTEAKVTDAIETLKREREKRLLRSLKESGLSQSGNEVDVRKLRELHLKLSELKPRYDKERANDDDLF